MEFVMIFFYLFTPLMLLVGGGVIGHMLEQNHFRSIEEREQQFKSIPCINGTALPSNSDITYARLASGSVVVSVDKLKKFLAGIILFFGGNVVVYDSLIERGRREALLRMKQAAPNADMYINVRLVTSSLSRGGNKSIGSIEVLAYGTALKFRN